jgi:hypothetical protein
MSFVKIHEGILRSSICDSDIATRWCWITILVLADRHGVVRSTPSGLARAGNLPPADVLRALDVLMAPDPSSASPDEEGRRLVSVAGGWRVVMYQSYRDRRDVDETREAAAERQRRHRQVIPSQAVTPSHTPSHEPSVTSCDASQAVTVVTESNANAEAEAEAEAEEEVSTASAADHPPAVVGSLPGRTDQDVPSETQVRVPRRASLSENARRLWMWWLRAMATWSPDVVVDVTEAGEPKTKRDSVLLNGLAQRYTYPMITFCVSRGLEGKRSVYWRSKLVNIGMLSAKADELVGEFGLDLKALEMTRRWCPDERLDAARP